MHMLNHQCLRIVLATLTAAFIASAAQAGPFDNVLKRMEDTVNKRSADMGEDAVDSVFDEANDTVRCAANDEECKKRERAQAKEPTVKPATTARCLATDVPCLQEAKRRNQTIEIMDESEVDTFRCSMSDRDCMERAKKLGKKVELID